jgi:hypothetical protein
VYVSCAALPLLLLGLLVAGGGWWWLVDGGGVVVVQEGVCLSEAEELVGVLRGLAAVSVVAAEALHALSLVLLERGPDLFDKVPPSHPPIPSRVRSLCSLYRVV